MTKYNKLRYKSKGNQFPTLFLTGKVEPRKIGNNFSEEDYDDENEDLDVKLPEKEIPPEKGDIQIFLSTDSVSYNPNVGNFESVGLDGYLKANVFDGKGWKPLSLEEFFPRREHYFGKRERPLETYTLCFPTFQSFKGTEIVRTYREHYRIKTPGDESNNS
ncbi:MAG: hypothetical protein WCJ33_04475 [Pseudomonadota bacterium]